MKTERLHYNPESALDFDAIVIATRPGAVATDRTAFYAEGGGQPSDRGVIRVNDLVYRVVSVAREDDLVWHRLDADVERVPCIEVGMQVSGSVDPNLRLAHSAHHTSLHLLNGLVFRDCGMARVTGAQIHPDRSRMDFQLPAITADLTRHLQDALDRQVAQHPRVLVYQISREEAERDERIVRTVGRSIPSDTPTVRVVEIEGLGDRQACGGTHLRDLGQVKRVVLHGFKSKGRENKRAEISVELV